MAFLDAGAKESLSDVVSKVLRKVLSQPEGKIEELDDTLLTWEILYFPGLITHYTRTNNRITRHYSPDSYKEEIYRSCISYIMNKLARSAMYLDKQLKSVKRNCRSMAFKLLKLRCPEYIFKRFESELYILLPEVFSIIHITAAWHLTPIIVRAFSHLKDQRWQLEFIIEIFFVFFWRRFIFITKQSDIIANV